MQRPANWSNGDESAPSERAALQESCLHTALPLHPVIYRGAIFQPTREGNTTKRATAVWAPGLAGPNAEGSKWGAFVRLVLPDPEVRAYVRRCFGQALYGANRFQAMLMIRGQGGNGKSTFVSAIAKALDSYTAHAKIELFLDSYRESPNGANADEVPMIGARLLVTSEPEPTDVLATRRVKAMTGGEPRGVRAPYAREQGFYVPRAIPLMMFNRTPRIKFDDHGTKRRLFFLPFEARLDQLPPGQRRPQSEVEAELAAPDEQSAILEWLAIGLADSVRRGDLAPPRASLELKANLLAVGNPLSQFLEYYVEDDPAGRIAKREFYKAFLAYCEEAGGQEFSARAVASQMPERGYGQIKSSRMYWTGLRWKADADTAALLAQAGITRPALDEPVAEDAHDLY